MKIAFKYINYIISIIKGSDFRIDNQIPLSYVIILLINKLFYFIYGCLVFKCKQRAFVHFSSKIKCKSKIKFKSNLIIERNCIIDALSSDGITFGKNVSLGMNTTIQCTGSFNLLGKGLITGNNVGLGTHGFFGCAGGIQIGNDTIFGNFVSIHSENHNYNSKDIPIRLQGVNRTGIKIGSNCWIGSKVTILDGAIIQDGCIIAAGALVSAGVYKSNYIYGGIPAKLIKYRFTK